MDKSAGSRPDDFSGVAPEGGGWAQNEKVTSRAWSGKVELQDKIAPDSPYLQSICQGSVSETDKENVTGIILSCW